MPLAFGFVSITAVPSRLCAFPLELRPLATSLFAPIGGRSVAGLAGLPVVWAVDEDAEEDDDASEAEIIVPPTEPLETTSDFDEDDFDDDFDDDFEEEFEDDEFDSEITPEDLEASDDSEDPFEDD